ncbi:hypothetical protein IW261DRAFT_1497440 [Armillaria novae-zelandiae]|uniref:Uncharacterized protein n=1 Tax=Armillaria novae-zelandiae TaxID=153914 RepID=A0AA39P012_9AGAR|nr:hypothetical protein IW261DRAFT_1497440 [Armillaria novae-zelandiae]
MPAVVLSMKTHRFRPFCCRTFLGLSFVPIAIASIRSANSGLHGTPADTTQCPGLLFRCPHTHGISLATITNAHIPSSESIILSNDSHFVQTV